MIKMRPIYLFCKRPFIFFFECIPFVYLYKIIHFICSMRRRNHFSLYTFKSETLKYSVHLAIGILTFISATKESDTSASILTSDLSKVCQLVRFHGRNKRIPNKCSTHMLLTIGRHFMASILNQYIGRKWMH